MFEHDGHGLTIFFCTTCMLYLLNTRQTDANLNFSLPVVMTDVLCFSSSTRLQDCSFSTSSIGCSIYDDRGVSCSNCSKYLCDDGQCVDGAQCDGKTDCADGSDEDAFTCGQFSKECNTVIPVLMTTCIQRPPVFKDHSVMSEQQYFCSF